MNSPQFTTLPPPTPTFTLSYPSPGVVLITISRPQAMNALATSSHFEADSLIQWFDHEPSLSVAIITGSGQKAFCAGQDLIEQNNNKTKSSQGSGMSPTGEVLRHPKSGFCGISRRTGRKPIIAAVNGFALGGGFEIVLNCDIIVASPTASFGLPEPSIGLYAAAGGLPRLMRIVGLPLASEIALTGRRLSAPEALAFGLINKVSEKQENVIGDAVEMAKKINAQSPDAIIVTRAGLREALETASVERAAQLTAERFEKSLFEAENLKIGLAAFAGKRKPKWVPSKL